MAHDANFYKGIASVFGGFLVQVTLGTFYTLGNVNTYLTSYIRANVNGNAQYADSIWINAISMLGQGLLMPLGGFMEARIGARLTVLIGCTIFSCSIAITYYTIKLSFFCVLLSYGFSASLGMGIAYVAPLAAGMKWFPDNKGLVNGITVGGFGLGALIFNPIQTAYMNPENFSPAASGYFQDERVLSRVPGLFLLLGGIYGLIALIGSMMIFKPPAEPDEIIFSDGRLLLLKSPQDRELDYSSGEDEQQQQQSSVTGGGIGSDKKIRANIVKTKTDLGLLEALRTKEFAQMWLMFALCTQGVQFINTMYKAYGQQFIKNDHFLAFVGSFASACNAIGRIFWGYLLDRTNFRTTFSLLCIIFTVLVATLFLTQLLASSIAFLFWICAIFFTFSGIFAIFPTVTWIVFGRSHAGTIYGFLFTAPAFASIIGAFLVELIQQTFSWAGSLFAVAVCTILALMVLIYSPIRTRRAIID